uniref:Endoplasmic reticulum membrane sensor NFE2L1 n=1 Tax=Myripristis murdjan TaxID=586833 RepID=A0A667WKK2_9TELE
MWYLKKYFTEGLIQVAILLSLCGVRVDVGLEPYLPPAWHEMILGPTSALTQTQFHNLRNRLEDGQGLHPKSVDLDGFFTARRLLGWVRSLDRLQVPNAELETWLVQREPDPLPGGRPDQASPLQRAPAGLDRDRAAPQMQPGAGNGTRDEEDEDVKEVGPIHLQFTFLGLLADALIWSSWTGANRMFLLKTCLPPQSSLSLQECLRLLEETFPFTEEPQVHPLYLILFYIDSVQALPWTKDHPSLDLELHWQDLLAIMEPQVSGTETRRDIFSAGLDTESNMNTFCMNSLTQDLADNINTTLTGSQYSPYAETFTSYDANIRPNVLASPSYNPSLNLNDMTHDFSASTSSLFLVDDEDKYEGEEGLPSPLGNLLHDDAILDEMSLLDLALEEGFSPEMADEDDSDSGLSLDFSHSPASPCASEASSYSYSSSSSSSSSSVSAEEEEMGAAGGSYSTDVKKFLCGGYQDHRLFNRPPWLEHIGHDHTYNQPWSSTSSPTLGKMPTKHAKSSPRHDNTKPYHRSSAERVSEAKMWSRDERRARAMKIPFSNELIINLPVEEFNELLANHRLNDEQLTLVRDIRRRGKNKMAAQNCRKRKLDVLLGLEESVLGLRRHRLRLLQEKQEALRALKEMRRRLDGLYQEVFSSLRDEDGRPLDATEYTLQFGPNDRVIVASRRQAASLPQTNGRNSRKPRDKKK